jgi:hypothetical protein
MKNENSLQNKKRRTNLKNIIFQRTNQLTNPFYKINHAVTLRAHLGATPPLRPGAFDAGSS